MKKYPIKQSTRWLKRIHNTFDACAYTVVGLEGRIVTAFGDPVAIDPAPTLDGVEIAGWTWRGDVADFVQEFRPLPEDEDSAPASNGGKV